MARREEGAGGRIPVRYSRLRRRLPSAGFVVGQFRWTDPTCRRAASGRWPMNPIARAAAPPVRRGLRLWTRLTRSVTLGVRTLVLSDDGRVFLVRHGYVDGWHLPGGAVDPGETAVDAAVRELAEEGNIAADGVPDLAGLYLNAGLGRDHVALYVVRRFRVLGPPRLGREIAAAGFFGVSTPPPETTPATLRRIAEVTEGLPPAATW